MYSLLIVDDEIAVTNGIAYDIEWEDIGIANIYQANTARHALDIMRANRIDVVISDICMPDMNGIELTRYIRKQWPFVKVILLSGYEEFEYAKDAIELKVMRYVKKPVRYRELKSLVQDALREIKEHFEFANLVEASKKASRETAALLRERYLNAWIVHGQESPWAAADKWQACHLPLRPDWPFFLAMLRPDYVSVSGDRVSDMRFDPSISDVIERVFFKDESGIVFQDRHNRFILLIQRETQDELAAEKNYVESMAETFQQIIKSTFDITVSVFVSDLSNDLRDAHMLYAQMKDLSSLHAVLQGGGVVVSSRFTGRTPPNQRNRYISAYPPLFTLIESLQKESAMERIDNLFSECRATGAIPIDSALKIFQLVTGDILELSMRHGFSIDQWAKGYGTGFYAFERFSSLDDLQHWCELITRMFIDHISKQARDSTRFIVSHAKSLIEGSPNHDISLSDIASQLFVHPNYLSRIFKETEGVTITDYSIALRVDKAKTLLARRGAKVYEVAEAVGYESNAHFTRTFKRLTGMTPKEYQSRYC